MQKLSGEDDIVEDVALSNPGGGDPGEVIFFQIITKKIIWKGEYEAYMHVFNDITTSKTVERLKAFQSSRKMMFANITHEFRTPLNSMIWSLNQSLKLTKEREVNQRSIEKISEHVKVA